MTDKQDNEASAEWGLSSLWRPQSQYSDAQSTMESTQEGYASYWSRAIPWILFNPFSRSRESQDEESASMRGTASLLPSQDESRHRSDTLETDDSEFATFSPISVPPEATEDSEFATFSQVSVPPEATEDSEFATFSPVSVPPPATEDSEFATFSPVSVPPPATESRLSALSSPKEEAFARLVRPKKTSPRHSHLSSPARAMSSMPDLRVHTGQNSTRRHSRISTYTRSSKRESLRRTSIPIAELPALPMTLEGKPPSRPDTMYSASVFATPGRGMSPAPPPVPLIPKHQSVQDSDSEKDSKSHHDSDSHLVLWNGPHDRGNALNWSRPKKWASTLLLGCLTFCVAFTSSVTSSAAGPASAHFRASPDLFVLSTALYMIGVAIGTMIWSPMNDLCGRQVPLYIGMVACAVFQIPVAVAQNLATVFVCRFLAGVFACAPIITVVGSTCDLWSPLERGVALSVFSAALVAGPAAGPLIGGLVTDSVALGWRWTSWISFIICVFFGLCSWLFHRETAGSILLERRAKRLRRSTRDWALHAPSEEHEFNMRGYIDMHVWKPMVMLFTEPMLLLMTLYMSYAYGILYLLVEMVPLLYVGARHWSLGTSGIPLAAVIGGVLIGCVISILFTIKRQIPNARKYGHLFPEERLLPMIVGSVLFPIGLLLCILGSTPRLTPIPEIIGGVPLGIGVHLILLQGTNYLLDVYTLHAGAAIAVNTAIRSIFAAAFSSFARSLFRNLQPRSAGLLLGVIGLAFIPLPILFFKFGVKIRATSAFTVQLPSGSGDSSDEGGHERK